VMAKPVRNANSTGVLSSSRTFFATTKTSMGWPVFQSEINAALLMQKAAGAKAREGLT
jgi:hypothetical protein